MGYIGIFIKCAQSHISSTEVGLQSQECQHSPICDCSRLSIVCIVLVELSKIMPSYMKDCE